MDRIFITAKEAKQLLPDTNEIHTLRNFWGGVIGTEWSRNEIIELLEETEQIEIAGETARSMKHGIAVLNDIGDKASKILFVETDPEKLDKFYPLEVENV